MTEQDYEQKYKTFEGYGIHKTAAEWARAFALPRNTVWRYLHDGLTPEQIAERRGVSKAMLDKMDPYEVRGERKSKTLRLIADLLERSDYDPEELEIEIVPGAYCYKVKRLGDLIGAYNYQADILQLSGGDRLYLQNPIVPETTIFRGIDGWMLTQETKRRLARKNGLNYWD